MRAKNKAGEVYCNHTFAEVAAILTARGHPMTAKTAWHLEQQALRKIATDPHIRQLARELGLLPIESGASEVRGSPLLTDQCRNAATYGSLELSRSARRAG